MTRLIDADDIEYTMLYKENWITGCGVEAQGVWKTTIDEMPTVDAIPIEFIGDYVKHKASPFGEIVINDMMKEWLNSKYGLGHNTNKVKGEEE